MKRAGPGWFLLFLVGLAALLGSFLPFYTYARGVEVTVWSRGLFPTAALIPVLGFAIALEALFVLVRGHEPRSPFLNFTWEQARIAVGAFMVLLALSYLVQDRAGGALGLGYLVLSLSALATFAGGIMTRRAQLARAPGEAAPAREARPLFKPALATVGRVSGDLAKGVADRSRNAKARAAERRQVRLAARRDAAEKAAARRAELQAAADKAAAEKAVADEAAAKKAAAEKAAAEKVAAAKKAAEEKAAAEKAAADKAAAVTPEEPAVHPAPPTATVDELPAEPAPPTVTVDEPAEAPAPPAATVDELPEEPVEPTAESATERTDELPTAPVAAENEAQEEEPAAVTKLSAVPAEPDPDATPPPDGETAPSDGDKEPGAKADADSDTEEDEKRKEKEKENAESSTES
jgi:hypothetical protein